MAFQLFGYNAGMEMLTFRNDAGPSSGHIWQPDLSITRFVHTGATAAAGAHDVTGQTPGHERGNFDVGLRP